MELNLLSLLYAGLLESSESHHITCRGYDMPSLQRFRRIAGISSIPGTKLILILSIAQAICCSLKSKSSNDTGAGANEGSFFFGQSGELNTEQNCFCIRSAISFASLVKSFFAFLAALLH